MDEPNAFVGRATLPTPMELTATLGKTPPLWEEFVTWLVTEKRVNVQEWNSVSPNYGWALHLKLKKRTIVYLGPRADCFRVSFVLRDRAVAVARASDLPSRGIKALDEAPRYAEGTGLRLMIKGRKDLEGIRELAAIKLAN